MRFLIKRWSIVIILPTFTVDGEKRPARLHSSLLSVYPYSFRSAYGLEVTATAIISYWVLLNRAEEITTAGRYFTVVRSVKGKGIRMISPGL